MRPWQVWALVSHWRLRRLRLAQDTVTVVTGLCPLPAMAGSAPTARIVLIELTGTIPDITIIRPLMVTLGTDHLLGLLRTGVGVSRACAGAILPTKD
jgi:hypothetical protein